LIQVDQPFAPQREAFECPIGCRRADYWLNSPGSNGRRVQHAPARRSAVAIRT
jgi:hypothetical protein